MNKFVYGFLFLASAALAELKPEPLMRIENLPEKYPPHWIIAVDAAFFHMSNGKVIVLDANSDNAATRYKGMFNGSFIPQFYQGKFESKMYIIETYHSRGNRGERTDVLTTYDKANLQPISEVILPPKRASSMPTNFHLQMVEDDKFALVYNFTPAQSVTVVNMQKQEVVGEIPTPGCALVYPMAGRAFASLCADGSMMSVQLDGNGGQLSSARTEKFFNADTDPIMEKAVIHDNVAYFPTFHGRIVAIDLSGDEAKPVGDWSIVEGVEGGWRPGGISVITADSEGDLYVMMHPDGTEGTHKYPASEVWQIDTENRSVRRRIEMALPVLTIAVTRDDELLVGTTIEMNIDVYNRASGSLLRTLSDFGQETPFMLHGAN